MALLIRDVAVISSDGLADWIFIDGGKILDIGMSPAPEVGDVPVVSGADLIAMPGFIDVHVHGAVGYDTMDATPEALAKIAAFFASHGVTGFLATTMTASGPDTLRALENVAACQDVDRPFQGGAALLGAHLEGPYINVNAKGAQEGKYVRLADPAEYTAWLNTGAIKQVTVAPEFPENQAFISECAERGINISIGHTQATYEQTLAGVAIGARQVTHTFNAMTGLHHRKPGVAGAALTHPLIACELIADNIHVHPAILDLVAKAKGARGVVVITDAIRGAGMPDGIYDLGGQAVTVKEGMATLADGTLAGSVLTMDRALRNMLSATGHPLDEMAPMLSGNAARQLGLDHRKGRLKIGYDADIVLLDSACEVVATIVAGEIVYNSRQ